MKTNQIMKRSLADFEIEQRTKDKMFYATGLLRQWNASANQDKKISHFFALKSTNELIQQMKADAAITASLYTKVKGGSLQCTWMHEITYNVTKIMNKLLQLHDDAQGNRLVSARELHQVLESKREFATWIKDRIKKLKLTEGEDYFTSDNFVKRGPHSNLGTKRTEYHIMINPAKHICLIENTSKGYECRQYLIDVEKNARTLQQNISQVDVMEQMVKTFREQDQRITQLEGKVQQIENSSSTGNYMTIMGYAVTISKRIDVKVAATIGRKASSLCNANGYVMGTIPDPRFGRVKTYPKEVLQSVFKDYFN